MPTDFRSGTVFPRRGREVLSGYNWLARLFDKARAAADGTIHDYIYPCPMDKGVLERWGVSIDEFDTAVVSNRTDAEIVAWAKGRVDDAHRETANRWVLDEKSGNLDKQDGEEGVAAA